MNYNSNKFFEIYYSAGMETIKSSLLGMIMIMLRNPKAKRCMQEVKSSVPTTYRETLYFNNVRDLIDVYLVEIEKAKTEGRAGELFEGRDHELQLKQILGDLFSAGMETIKSSLLWMIVIMLRNPKAKRCMQEVKSSVATAYRTFRTQKQQYWRRSACQTLCLWQQHTYSRRMSNLNGYRISAGSQVNLIN